MTHQPPSAQPPVAIIGMGGMFARSENLKAYWRTLLNGIDCITDPPPTHPRLVEGFDPDPKRPDHIYCNRGGFLPTVNFDPTEFGIPPAALEATDTSQLLGLVAAKMALADAGYGEDRAFDREHTSVVIGVTGTQELVIALGSRLGHPIWRKSLEDKGLTESQKEAIIDAIADGYVSWQENSFPGLLGNVVAGRICNRLNLGGTNCVVDAACASSLSAVHLGLMELYTGKSDMVVTGGVDTINDIFMHMCFARTGVLSHHGDARPFSADADGTVLGEGIGILVLKRLADAERDGDRIYALIRGIGASSDGKSQSIYAPRPEGQARALAEAYHHAGISPGTIGLVEAHGTGTRVGDEVEFTALKRVFGPAIKNGRRCALGSVKSMIGHTKAAAGAAGLIKATLALFNKVLPPTLKAATPDPDLDIGSSPFYLNDVARPWFRTDAQPRRGGVSAFGFGGSNFHVVLEEYQGERTEIAWDGSIEILVFSGADNDAVHDQIQAMHRRIDDAPDDQWLARDAHALRHRFSADHPQRMVVVTETLAGRQRLADQLAAAQSIALAGQPAIRPDQGIYYLSGARCTGKIAYLYPGQGSQYPGMGRDLVCRFPSAMQAIESMATHFEDTRPLWDYIFPEPALSDDARRQQSEALRRTDVAQPAIGAVSLAMTAILNDFGLAPDATTGHSYGELPALFAARRIDRDTLSTLTALRGRLMADAGKNGDAGRMLAVNASHETLARLVEGIPDAVVANVNSPNQSVLSGSTQAIAAAREACAQEGLRTVDLPVAAAFHSPLVEAAQAPFSGSVAKITFAPSDIPVYANLSAAPYPDDSAAAADLLGRQLTGTVRFKEVVERLYADGVRTFVEIGPKGALSGLVRDTLADRDDVSRITLDRSYGKKAGIHDLAHAIAHLAVLGADIDLGRWEAIPDEPRPRKMTIPLSGANYRSPRKPQPKTVRPADAAPGKTDATIAARTPATACTTAKPQPHSNPNRTQPREIMKTHIGSTPRESAPASDAPRSGQAPHLNDALALVRKGMASIQSIQEQTTRAHQTFLETQAQASRTLQEMMTSTRMLVESARGIAAAPQPVVGQIGSADQAPDVVHPLAASVAVEPRSDAGPQADSDTAIVPDREPAVSTPPASSTQSVGEQTTAPDAAVADALIHVVAELTGYPTEMLDLSMDIEADLGIDSIKRVEILSAMEERMPHLPQVTPDMVGALKTLGQISDYLAGGSQTTDLNTQATPTNTEIPAASASFATSPAASAADATDIAQTLVSVVAELTGYPTEMLDLSMDIEADLGIDSIKRVEILSAMEERMPHLPQVSPDMVGTLKTLGQISDYLAGSNPTTDLNAQATTPDAETKAASAVPEAQPAITRQIIDVVVSPKTQGRPLKIASDRTIVVVDDGGPLTMALADDLNARGLPTRIVSMEAIPDSGAFSGAAGLILLPGTTAENAFLSAHRAGPELMEAAEGGDAVLAAITTMDGAFGFTGYAISHPQQGALPGLVKTAGLEWAQVICRAIDLSPDLATAVTDAVQAVNDEIAIVNAVHPVEIGLSRDRRIALKTVPAETIDGPLHLDKNDVVVVTGGARGVTANCALALAEATGASIALVGRSQPPDAPLDWLRGVHGEGAIKKAIATYGFPDAKPTPKALESAYRSHVSAMAVHQTLDQLTHAGVQAAYFSCDVTDRKGLGAVVESIQNKMGPITALIHGAGVLHDRLIVDKRLAQFRQVYNTKVNGLENLLDAVDIDRLRYLVLFSSVSARTGNTGQCDYAMANEVLNKMAHRIALAYSDCRVVSINWGPWDGGMVTPSLKKAFEHQEIQLIPLETGARMLVNEMKNGDPGPVEVVIGDMLTPDDDAVETGPAPLSMLERRSINLERYPVLASHVIGGRPVVPFALIGEWIGHGALKQNPGFTLHGIDDFRLLSGIRIEAEEKLVRLMAGKAVAAGDTRQVEVELRNGVKNGRDVIHSRARALLMEELPSPPPYRGNGRNGSHPYPRDLKDIYGEILFHGDQLRAIRSIVYYSEQGMTAHLVGAPKPSVWMEDPIREHWTADPMVLDGAFQMAIVWCYEQTGKVCLPSYARAYRQYCQAFPPMGVTAVMTVTSVSHRKMVADFTFLDDDGQVVATLSGYEATIDQNLMHAFQNNGLVSGNKGIDNDQATH